MNIYVNVWNRKLYCAIFQTKSIFLEGIVMVVQNKNPIQWVRGSFKTSQSSWSVWKLWWGQRNNTNISPNYVYSHKTLHAWILSNFNCCWPIDEITSRGCSRSSWALPAIFGLLKYVQWTGHITLKTQIFNVQ